MEQYHGTTILSVRRGGLVAMGGDGQVTLGNIVIKASARKVRRIYQERILAGFAGGTADAFTLFERFEAKLDKHQGNLLRSAVELAKDWRSDRALRRLEAMLAVADRVNSLVITGNGDVLEPEQGIVAIGSGGAFAQSAARARSSSQTAAWSPPPGAVTGTISISRSQPISRRGEPKSQLAVGVWSRGATASGARGASPELGCGRPWP